MSPSPPNEIKSNMCVTSDYIFEYVIFLAGDCEASAAPEDCYPPPPPRGEGCPPFAFSRPKYASFTWIVEMLRGMRYIFARPNVPFLLHPKLALTPGPGARGGHLGRAYNSDGVLKRNTFN